MAPRARRAARPAAHALTQPRALQTREKLLRAGEALLQNGGFDQVSIAQIAELAGCSVGTFYFSFRDKEAYFRFLLDSVMARVQARGTEELAPARFRGLDLVATVRTCVAHFIGVTRDYEGLTRTVTQHTAHNIEGWQPMRTLGSWLGEHYAERAAAHFPTTQRARVRANAMVGFQIVMGFIVNAILHPSPQLPFDSPHLDYWMHEVVLHCIRLPGAPPPGPSRA